LAVLSYLHQVPATVQRSLRRAADPSGKTLPPGLDLSKGEDLLPFLPTHLSRFKTGDHPLPGVDWVLDELLGVGGFGEVWKAHNPHLGSLAPVALKFCIDPLARQRLLTHEAKVIAQVMRQGRHPGIVALEQTFLRADPPCLQYEFIEGGDLAGLIQEWHRGPSKPSHRNAAKVAHRIAEIMGFAHRLDPPIVHRDLKPSNILVQRADGKTRLKVADFGIGGVVTEKAISATRRGLSAGALMTSVVRGSYTPSYASPEQMRGHAPDPRDDVHAIGVIWYQALTGDFGQGRPGGRGWRSRLVARGMSAELIDLMETCFEDDFRDRPADAAVLAEALGKLIAPAPVPPPPPDPSPVREIPAPSQSSFEHFMRLGDDSLDKENWDQAVIDFGRALEIDPTSGVAFRKRGNAWSFKGEPDKAIGDYDSAIRLDPEVAHFTSEGASKDKGGAQAPPAKLTKGGKLSGRPTAPKSSVPGLGPRESKRFLKEQQKLMELSAQARVKSTAKAPPAAPAKEGGGPSHFLDIPNGTECRLTVDGKTHVGVLRGLQLKVGRRSPFTSLSAAYQVIAGRPGNAWKAWELRLPGSSEWVRADEFRNRPTAKPGIDDQGT